MVKLNCSEKYGNDLPTAVRSDVGRNEETMVTDMAMTQNSAIPVPMMNSIPVTVPMTEYVNSSTSPLPPKLDNQGSFVLPPVSTATATAGAGAGAGGVGRIPSQNSVLRGVSIY